ncbi:tetratricopeptide repeat protein 12 isoform X2 [Pseudophryne corroboree]|uniref:tetratricopeptide repeat protein 12 isoform X2 n=1 Tax=Pseudophryne corroboree TaxID=495146 RepID=UPI0030814602
MSVEQNLEQFLKDVDEIAEIIQGLSSDDATSQEHIIAKADQKLALLKKKENEDGIRTKTNRTVFNNSPAGSFPQSNSEMSQDSFLAHLEKDAAERAEKRTQDKALANALKDLGNEAYAKGDYESAVQHYSEGLEILRDMQVLYTNRAQAYIKMEKYQNAITDCEWALKCDEKCLKAYVHMGKAYLGLKKYDEARKYYKKITDLDGNKEKMVKGYLNQVDSQEMKDMQEKKASRDLEAGAENAVSVTQLLQKLYKTDQIPLYYSGGLQLLANAVKDCTTQTVFRTNSGFNVIGDNTVINRSLISKQADPMDVDLCLSVLTLWQAVCTGNEENQRLFISHPNVTQQLLALLSSDVPDVQSKTLDLLSIYSMTEEGRSLLVKHLHPSRLLKSLVIYVTLMDRRAVKAMDILHSLTLEQRLKPYFRTDFLSESLPLFNRLLTKSSMSLVNMAVFPLCIAVIGHLTEDRIIRSTMAGSLEFWNSCLLAVDECSVPAAGQAHQDILVALLGLMFNLSLEENSVIQRSVGILSRVLPQCTAAVGLSVQGGIVKKLIKCLKAGGQRTSSYAVKVLAVCTKQDPQAQSDVVKYDKKFATLVPLLCSEDEKIIGNTALCLGNCFNVPGAAASLLQSDIVKLLLTHAGGDANQSSVQQNAAIALGKLCTAEPRYMMRLRELHGIEILNSCMKYIK